MIYQKYIKNLKLLSIYIVNIVVIIFLTACSEGPVSTHIPDSGVVLAPTILSAEVVSSGEITLRWISPFNNSGIVNYNIYRKNNIDEEYSLLGQTVETTYVDSNLNENNYIYSVSAVNKDGTESEKHFGVNIWCRTGLKTIWSESCSQEDVQAAVDKASDGDTVIIPAGEGQWENRVEVKYKGLIIQGAGVENTVIKSAGAGSLIYSSRFNGSFIRITGISFNGNDSALGLDIHALSGTDGRKPGFIRIDHNQFEHCTSRAIQLWRYIEGVIDNNTFESNATADICFYGDNDSSYERPETPGSIHALYVEDNSFRYIDEGNDPEHAIASNDGARYVFRHNHIFCNVRKSNYHLGATIDAHGNFYSERGTYSYEIYNNTIESDSFRGMYIRGGTGVIFNNELIGHYDHPIHLTNYLSFRGDLENLTYPCPDQIHDLYIWGNSYNGDNIKAEVDSKGIVQEHIQENRDFFNAEKPDYEPYNYPHPWTSQYPSSE